ILLLYEHVSCETVSWARCQKSPSLLSLWSPRQGTFSEFLLGAQSMPRTRWGSPTGSSQAARHCDAVCAAWKAASLCHSERITLILKRSAMRRCFTGMIHLIARCYGYPHLALSLLAAVSLHPADKSEVITIMVYYASHNRRHHPWRIYSSPTCRFAPRSSWISPVS